MISSLIASNSISRILRALLHHMFFSFSWFSSCLMFKKIYLQQLRISGYPKSTEFQCIGILGTLAWYLAWMSMSNFHWCAVQHYINTYKYQGTSKSQQTFPNNVPDLGNVKFWGNYAVVQFFAPEWFSARGVWHSLREASSTNGTWEFTGDQVWWISIPVWLMQSMGRIWMFMEDL